MSDLSTNNMIPSALTGLLAAETPQQETNTVGIPADIVGLLAARIESEVKTATMDSLTAQDAADHWNQMLLEEQQRLEAVQAIANRKAKPQSLNSIQRRLKKLASRGQYMQKIAITVGMAPQAFEEGMVDIPSKGFKVTDERDRMPAPLFHVQADHIHSGSSFVQHYLEAEGLMDLPQATIGIISLDEFAEAMMVDEMDLLFGSYIEEGWELVGGNRLWCPSAVQNILLPIFGGVVGNTVFRDKPYGYDENVGRSKFAEEYGHYTVDEGIRDARSYTGALCTAMRGYRHNEWVTMSTLTDGKGNKTGADGHCYIHPSHSDGDANQIRGANPKRLSFAKGFALASELSAVIEQRIYCRSICTADGHTQVISDSYLTVEEFKSLVKAGHIDAGAIEALLTDSNLLMRQGEPMRDSYAYHKMNGVEMVLNDEMREHWTAYRNNVVAQVDIEVEIEGQLIETTIQIEERHFGVVTLDTLSVKGPWKKKCKALSKLPAEEQPVITTKLSYGFLRDFSRASRQRSGFQLIMTYELGRVLPCGRTVRTVMKEILSKNLKKTMEGGKAQLLQRGIASSQDDRSLAEVCRSIGIEDLSTVPTLADAINQQIGRDNYTAANGAGERPEARVMVIDDTMGRDEVAYDYGKNDIKNFMAFTDYCREHLTVETDGVLKPMFESTLTLETSEGPLHLVGRCMTSRYPVMSDAGSTTAKVVPHREHQLIRDYTKRFQLHSMKIVDGKPAGEWSPVQWEGRDAEGNAYTHNGKDGINMNPLMVEAVITAAQECEAFFDRWNNRLTDSEAWQKDGVAYKIVSFFEIGPLRPPKNVIFMHTHIAVECLIGDSDGDVAITCTDPNWVIITDFGQRRFDEEKHFMHDWQLDVIRKARRIAMAKKAKAEREQRERSEQERLSMRSEVRSMLAD